ncbi:MAG: hypothetical protein V1784_12855 [bacterium]
MIKEAIEKILDISNPGIMEFSGRKYATKGIIPIHDPSPTALDLQTLTGLRDYLQANIDKLASEALLLHVFDYANVALISKLENPWLMRETYVVVKCDTLKFPFGSWMDVETFIIRMQSQFVPSAEVDNILRLVGNVADSVVKQFNDDGVTQQATVKTGVSRVENVAVPNPAILAPYRTFLEVEQPASRFVFRMRSGNDTPVCALFEADGGDWKNKAILRIKKWLQDNTKDIAIVA